MSSKFTRFLSSGSQVEDAVLNKDFTLLASLLDDINWTDFNLKEGNNFLDFALYVSTCVCNEKTSIKLIEYGATPYFWNFGVIIEAISANKEKVLDKLLEFNIPRDYSDDASPMGFLGVAASNGHLNLVKKLVSLNFDYHLWDDGAFRYALVGEHFECVKYLHSLGNMKVETADNYALIKLIEKDNIEILMWLLEKYPSIKENRSIYLSAIWQNNNASSLFFPILKKEVLFKNNPSSYYNLFSTFLNSKRKDTPELSRKEFIDILLERSSLWLSNDINLNKNLLFTIHKTCSDEEIIYILNYLKIHELESLKDEPLVKKFSDYIKLQKNIVLKNKKPSLIKV